MISFKQYLDEENTQGDIGTRKLALHHLRFTPGQVDDVPNPLEEFEKEIDRTTNGVSRDTL